MKESEDLKKHDHIVIELADQIVVYNDPRRFGFIDHYYDGHPRLVHLGPEPHKNEFTLEGFYLSLKSRSAPIKNVIMDSKIVVGVGNIYASEALFRSKISPLKSANSMSKNRVELLHSSIKKVIHEAIKAGGSSIRDYTQPGGAEGHFQMKFNVYGRAGELCKICKSEIVKIIQAGRSSFYCKKCQK